MLFPNERIILIGGPCDGHSCMIPKEDSTLLITDADGIDREYEKTGEIGSMGRYIFRPKGWIGGVAGDDSLTT